MSDTKRLGFMDVQLAERRVKCACGRTFAGNAYTTVCAPCLECAARSARSDRLGAAGNPIPREYRWARFDAPEMAGRVRPSAIAAAREAFGARTLVLRGPAGAGKTSLAAAILREHLARGLTSDKLCDFACRARWSPSVDVAKLDQWGRPDRGVVDAAIGASLLVLDDLGAESPPAAFVISEIVLSRFDKRRPIVVTTWLEDDQPDPAKGPLGLAQRYGGGVSRRLLEPGRATVLRLAKVAR